MNDSAPAIWQDVGKLLLRVTLGGLLLFHGISKVIHGVAWMAKPLAALHLPAFISYGVYIGEIVAPVLIIVGLLTRPAALVVAFDLVMAFVLVAWHRIFTVSRGGGWGVEAEAFFLLLALTVFFFGPGRFGVTGKRAMWS